MGLLWTADTRRIGTSVSKEQVPKYLLGKHGWFKLSIQSLE